ncbi:MAG: hypothetical protein ACR5K2_02695 [Wolbachia sp.]
MLLVIINENEIQHYLAFYNVREGSGIEPFLKDELNIDLSIKGSKGTTPLLAAVRSADLNVVKSLLTKLGTKIDDKDSKRGGSILHHVLASPNIPPVRYTTSYCTTQHQILNVKMNMTLLIELLTLLFIILKSIRSDSILTILIRIGTCH